MKIDRPGRFHFRAVPDLVEIPGQEPDVDALSGHGIDQFIAALFETDGVVEIDPAPALDAEQLLNVNGFGDRCADTFPAQATGERRDPQAGVDGVVVLAKPLGVGLVDAVEGVGDRGVTVEELLSNGSKIAFNFAAFM